jgi:hypothetical protein
VREDGDPSPSEWCASRPSITWDDLGASLGFLWALALRRALLDRHVTPRGQAPLGNAPSRTMAQAAVVDDTLECL